MNHRVIVDARPRSRMMISAVLATLRAGLGPDSPAAEETWPAPRSDSEGSEDSQTPAELVVPAGSLVVGLALLDDSVLTPTPAGKVLNRNVRGLLRGLRAQYFGTQHLVVGGRPVAWLGCEHDDAGRLLLTAIVGVEAPLATVPITDLRGRAWASLCELGDRDSFEGLAERVVAGYRDQGL